MALFSRHLVDAKIHQRNSRAHMSVRWLTSDVTLKLVDVSATLAIVQSFNVMEINAIRPALGADVQRAKESLTALISHVGSVASRPLLLLPSLDGIASTESAAALYRSIAENAIVRHDCPHSSSMSRSIHFCRCLAEFCDGASVAGRSPPFRQLCHGARRP